MRLYKALSDAKAAELGHQQFFETLKHLTTLNTGSILILTALFEKLSQQPQWRFLIGLSFLLFILSTIASLMLMLWHSSTADETLDKLTVEGFGAYVGLMMIATWSFVLGMVALAIFAFKNFY